MSVDKLLDDDREIWAIEYPDGGGVCVGQEGVTKIVVYGEPGLYCYMPWFAVYQGNHLASRWAAGQGLAVSYKKLEKEKTL